MIKIIIISLLFYSQIFSQDSNFELFALSDLVKVFEDGYNLPSKKSELNLFGIKGETISAQFVIHSSVDLENVEIMFSDLVSSERDVAISSDAIKYNYVKSVPVNENSNLLQNESMVREAPALFPDYLSEEKEILIKKEKYQSVWLTISIPYEASVAVYSGNINVETSIGYRNIPIKLEVYPFEMPKESHLYTAIWYAMSNKYHDYEKKYDEKYWNLIEVYANNMAAHRQNVFRANLGSIKNRLDKEGNLIFNFVHFDHLVEIYESTGMLQLLETSALAKHANGWEGDKIILRDVTVFDEAKNENIDMKGEDYLPIFLPAFEKHLKEKGWFHKTAIHVADEPSNNNIISWREASEFVHNIAPNFKRMDAIEGSFFDDRLEIWIPKIDQLNIWNESFLKAKANGNELWYYMAMTTNAYPNRFIDSPLIEIRILRWLNYRFDISGYLHYGLNRWSSDDPFNELCHPRYGIGADAVVYPKKDGIINSIRWEQVRNGLSDYEYLWLLEKEVEKLKNEIGEDGSWINPKQRGMEIANNVVQTMTEFTRNPDILYVTKKEILDEITDMQTSPKLYVQTNPNAGSKLVYAPILLEITGWTERGTKIHIDNNEVQVSENGNFRTAIALTPQRNVVTIVASKGNSKKEIKRSYEVVYP